MYTVAVWFFYDIVYGNELIEREDGDIVAFNRVVARYNRQRDQWARRFHVWTTFHPQTFVPTCAC
jgi:hypothetical protein